MHYHIVFVTKYRHKCRTKQMLAQKIFPGARRAARALFPHSDFIDDQNNFLQAEEEEIRGMWDWLHEHQACEQSFDTEDEAAVDAYEQLGLLQAALDGML